MSTLSLWSRRDPFAEFDSLIRSAFGPMESWTRDGIAFSPAAETVKDGEDAVIRLELPGLDAANDIDVEVTPGRLTVRGERRDERSEDSNGRTLREIRYGSFERSFGLPNHVTADMVTASYDAGILSVRVAGVYAGTEPRKIAISSPGSMTAVESSTRTDEAADITSGSAEAEAQAESAEASAGSGSED